MRIQLESPKNSGRTSHRPPERNRLPEGARQDEEADVLVEDVLMTAREIDSDSDQNNDDNDDEDEDEHYMESMKVIEEEKPTLEELGITTSEDLVRRLKAKDVPANDANKYEVAKAAFYDTTMHIPKKHRLLSEWMMEALTKDAKDLEIDVRESDTITFDLSTPANEKLIMHAYCWSLLAQCFDRLEKSDVAYLSNRFSLPHLLLSYLLAHNSHSWYRRDSVQDLFAQMSNLRTSRQALGMDTLNRCLAMALTNLYSNLDSSDDNDGPLEFRIKSLRHPHLVTTLEIILPLWSSEMSRAGNAEKTRQFFLTEVLFLYSIVALETSQAIKLCPEEEHQTVLVKLQELLEQTLYKSLFERVEINADLCKMMLSKIASTGSEIYPICSHFLSQMCEKSFSDRKRKRGASTSASGNLHTQAADAARAFIVKDFILPATDLVAIVSDIPDAAEDLEKNINKRTTCLHEMLECVDKYKLHRSSEDDECSSTTLLRKWAQYTLTVIKDTTYMEEDEEEAREPSYALLCSIHELDDRILQGDMQVEAIAAAWDILSKEEEEEERERWNPSKPDLIQSLFTTANQQRRIPGLLTCFFKAWDVIIEIEELRSSPDLKDLSHSLLFSEQYSEKTIEVALRDFISPQQAIDIFDLIASQLEDANSTYVSTKEKPIGSLEYTDNIRAMCLAALKMRFASQIIRKSSYASTDLQERIERIHDHVLTHCLKIMLPKANKDNDAVEEELVIAAFDMIESIQIFSRSCAVKEVQSGQKSWTDCAQALDLRQKDLKEHLIALCKDKNNGLYALRAQAHLVVISSIERNFQWTRTSPFETLLDSDFGFGLLMQRDIVEKGNEQQYFAMTYEGWADDEEKSISFLFLWRTIALKHLPTFERLASDRLLDQMASTAIQLIKYGYRKDSRPEDTVELTSNANNLELPRWREALCACLLSELSEKKSEGMHTIDAIRTLSSFPIEWFPTDFLQKPWPIILKYLGEKEAIDSGQELSRFLTICIEKRYDIVKPSLDNFKSHILPFCLCGANNVQEDSRKSLTLLFKTFIEHSITSKDDASREQNIKKLRLILEDKQWRQARPVWHLVQGTDRALNVNQILRHYRPCSLIVEWRAFLVEQTGVLLQQMSYGDTRELVIAAVLKMLRKLITQNDDHIELLDVEASPYWKTEGAYEPLISLLGLHRAALKVLTLYDKRYGKEERQLDYRTLTDAALTLYSNWEMIVDPDIFHQYVSSKARHQVGLALLQAREAGIEVTLLRGRTEVTRQVGIGSGMLNHIEADTIFTTWLNLFTMMFYIWQDDLDGHFLTLEEVYPILVTVCRSASAQEYEGSLELLLSILSRPGDEEVKQTYPGSDEFYPTRRVSHALGLTKILSVLLCNGPEGTLTISQRIFSRVLGLISIWVKDEHNVNNVKIEDIRDLCDGSGKGSIQMIEVILSSRPILFRSGDVADFLALASQVIQYKCGRDMERALETKLIFTSTVNALIDLIRLRRDFIALYLPQLTLLLKQLLGVFHSRYMGNLKKHHLEKKLEEELIEESTLRMESARLFNRLLSTITTKSTSNGTAGLPSSKLKSLAKPFSNHAIHVIVALIREMTKLNIEDPIRDSTYKTITFIKGEEREEIKRGIFHLCDIVGSWQKNVMMDMVSDDGERILMRSLWRDWEAQRYKGA